MSNEIAVSLVHKSAANHFYNSFFIIEEEKLGVLARWNPELKLVSSNGEVYTCRFNDFEVNVKTRSQSIIKSLREYDMAGSPYGFDILSLVSELEPDWENREETA